MSEANEMAKVIVTAVAHNQGLWQFKIRYCTGSGGLYRIEARHGKGTFFAITSGMHLTRANKMVEDYSALVELAEKVGISRMKSFDNLSGYS